MSYLLRGVAAGGGIRVVAADTTDLVNGAVEKHGATPTAGAALGRTLTGALLLSHVLLKNSRDRVTLRLRGDGPLGGVIADAGLDGTVRGYVSNPHVDLPLRDDGKLDVGGGIGREGEISVVRSHAPYGDPYGSSSDLVSGEVAEDIATYLARSEQIPSAVLLGVYFDEHRRVRRSGGVILQALPGADEGALTLLEANVKALGQLTTAMAGAPILDVVRDQLLWGMDFELLTDPPMRVAFACRCSDEKALEALAYFTPAERKEMAEQDGGAEVVCHWCGEKRWVGAEAILGIAGAEVRCPDCGTLWYRDGQTRMVRDAELCACGRPVVLPN